MVQRLLHSYTADADRYDEMLAADGRLRPHWRTLIDQLENLSPEMMHRRADEVRDGFASDGTTYNAGASLQGANRPHDLDLLPQVIAADEWRTLAAAVAQRARLLNGVLGDLYGPQHLLTESLLPPALVFGEHGYLWPCHGIRPPGEVYLHLYAIDLARSADGQWRVVGDRTQGPSGAGYALQNRQAMARVLPEALRDMHVQPLLGHFHTLHRCLTRLSEKLGAAGEPPLVVLLTPGPYNDMYPEHAFLAHTLGFQLVEGVDLTVRSDMVYLKTLTGLRRVHAIMRRLDDDYCDPLELRADSALGIPGLTQAARCGNVLIANALGSGVLESIALHGFLPAICQRLLGEDLALPAAASWWCGEKPALEYTLAHLDELVIMPASPSMRMQPVFGYALDAAARRTLVESLQLQPHAYVAQERMRLSQAPVLLHSGERRLTSGTVSLRVFAAADGEGGYRVMPGGLTRVAPHQRRDDVSMQQGGASKDVWVLSAAADDVTGAVGAEVGADTDAMPVPHASGLIRTTVDVSSHTGENLFWMGRYTERTDNLARLLRTTLQCTIEPQAENSNALHGISEICFRLGILPQPQLTLQALQQSLQTAIAGPDAGISIATHLRHLQHSGYQVREHLSPDNWNALNRMPAMVPEKMSVPVAALQVLNNVIQACSTLAGHALDDMPHDEGWQFLMIGRHIERMAHLATLFDVFLQQKPEHQDTALSWLLESSDSSVTYRVRYRRLPEWQQVLHLLVFDAGNPNSLAFQFRMLQHYLSDIAQQLGTLSMNIPAHLNDQLDSFALPDFARGSPAAATTNVRLMHVMRDASAAGFTLTDDLARHFFTPLGASISQGV